MKVYKKSDKKKTKKIFEQYAFGGVAKDRLNEYLQIQTNRTANAPNLIQTPDSALIENEIAVAKAQSSKNTGLTQALDFGGNLAMGIGGGMMAKGIENGEGVLGEKAGAFQGLDLGKFGQQALPLLQGYASGRSMAAMGGVMENVDINAEGGESIKMPGQQEAIPIEGASHENGGVDMTVPEGSVVYSKQLKKDEKSMAERQEHREKVVAQIERFLSLNPGNKVLSKTFERIQNNAKAQDTEDIKSMEKAKALERGVLGNPEQTANTINQQLEKREFAYGGKVNKYANGGPIKRYTTDKFGNPVPVDEKTAMGYNVKINEESIGYDTKNALKMKGIGGEQTDDLAVSPPVDEPELNNDFENMFGVNSFGKKINPIQDDSIEAQTNNYNNLFLPKKYLTDSEESKTPISNISPSDSKGKVKNKIDLAANAKIGVNAVNGFLKKQNGITAGDALGLYGQYKASTDPLKQTLANRAGDTPNQNFYKEYGKEGIRKLQESKQWLSAQKDAALLQAQNQYSNLSARSSNVMNALKLGEQAGKNANMTNAMLNYGSQMNGINTQLSSLKNQQDQTVMGGEQARVLANQQDRDNFYKQFVKDKETLNYGMQTVGKTVNELKEREVTSNLLNKLYNDFEINSMTGEMKRKASMNISQNSEFYKDLDKTFAKEILSNPNKYKVVGNRVYDVSSGTPIELDKTTKNPIKINNPANVNPSVDGRSLYTTTNFTNGLQIPEAQQSMFQPKKGNNNLFYPKKIKK